MRTFGRIAGFYLLAAFAPLGPWLLIIGFCVAWAVVWSLLFR